MQWLRDFRDEWTQPGYAHGKMAGLCVVGCILVALCAGVATGALILGVGDVGAGNVFTLWLFAVGFGIAAKVYVFFAQREIAAAERR